MAINKKRIGIIAYVLGLVALVGVSSGVTSAYFSKDVGKLQNIVTTGSVEITMAEDNWSPVDTIHPKDVVSKDPDIKNVGINNCWAFFEVRIPTLNIRTIGANKLKTEPKDTELYTFTVNQGWTQISKTRSGNQTIYVYGYNTELSSGQKTTKLFGTLKMCDYLEGQLARGTNYNVEVIAQAVQSNLGTNNLTTIYNEYLNQVAAGE